MTTLLLPLLLVTTGALSLDTEQMAATDACEGLALEELPTAYETNMMMNIKFGDINGQSRSIYEAVDGKKMKSFIHVATEVQRERNGTDKMPILMYEEMIWNPELSGIQNYLTQVAIGRDGIDGYECFSDSHPEDSFIQWLFGWDESHGFPSVLGMLHMDAAYTPGCPQVINGISVNTFVGKWKIDAWKTELDVKYFWSNKNEWYGSAGRNVSVPVAAVMSGEATIAGRTETIHIEIDFGHFREISFPEALYLPKEDLWCYGRDMKDKVPEIPSQISYTEEVILLWLNSQLQPFEVVIPRDVWLDYNHQITRTEYKPIDINEKGDPFDGKNGFVYQIDDFNTGLSYTISADYGNCSVDYLSGPDETGTVININGHIHMHNPFFTMNIDKFAFNGVRIDRSMEIDAYLRSAPPYHHPDVDRENETNVFFLSNSNFEVQDGIDPERLIPTKVEIYPSTKYNEPFEKFKMNVFHFSRHPQDFSHYDISPCFEEPQKLHLMVRMGWSPSMDLEQSKRMFNDEFRREVMLTGQVTNIRIVNIETAIDADNSALFVIWTVLDYPKGFDLELDDLPDAIRSLDEIQSNIQTAVDKGSFKVDIFTTGGGTQPSLAESGSLRVLGDRSGDYAHKNGYSSGSMAALGIMMLLITIGGILALLVLVLKW